MVNEKNFQQRVAKLSEQYFVESVMKPTVQAWLLGLNAVAILVSVNMSWPGKIRKKG